MAHIEQRNFCESVKKIFPEYFINVDVCDLGSLDLNGNNHYLFENYSYVGVDLLRGKNVNVVCKAHEFKLNNYKFDTVISTECFEHDLYWEQTFNNVLDNLLKDKGLFLMTCATTGRQEHGTSNSKPEDSPFTSQTENWSNYYKNLTEEDIENKIDLKKNFSIYRFYINKESSDLYFWGIKK